MRIVGDENLSLGMIVGKTDPPRPSATFFLKATFKLRPGEPAVWADEPDLVSGDVYADGDVRSALMYPSDFAPRKPRTDVVLIAGAHAPRGEQVSQFDVGFRVGGLRKTLRVFGERRWLEGGRASIPEPFVTLAIGYDQSFGGPGYARNPIGRGHLSDSAHRIEIPTRPVTGPDDDVEPAGFGPLPAAWPQRSALTGTYDEGWVRSRWPWFPEDFDFGYFNAAPRDQQVEGYLRGDEGIEFNNLHAEHTVYRTQLPGLRARCFLDEEVRGERRFRDVPLGLDTVWIDLNQEKLVLVWRGQAEVSTLKLREIVHTLIVTESVNAPFEDISFYHARMMESLSDSDLELPRMEASDDELDISAQEFSALDAVFQNAEADVANADSTTAKSLDPSWQLDPTSPPQTVSESRASLLAQIEQMRESGGSDPGVLEELEQQSEVHNELTQLEAEMNQAMPDEEPWTRQRVIEAAAGRETLVGQDLGELDLSSLNLAHLNLSAVRFSGANLKATDLSGADLRRADLSGTDLSGANLSKAVLDSADLSGAKLVGTTLTGVSISDSLLSKLELAGADFSEARGDGANFSGSNLKGANFVQAQLPRADFSGCSLERADFHLSQLVAAQFDGVDAPSINMEDAVIEGLHGSEKSNFQGGVFRRVRGRGSMWEESVLDGADFTGADLVSAQFPDAQLRAARFEHADLTNVVFDDAVLEGAVLRGANLLRASFERSNLRHADARGANLYEAGFCETETEGLNLVDAFVKGTPLEWRQ